MRLLSLLRKLRSRYSSCTSLIKVTLSQENLLYNLHAFQNAYPTYEIAPVLKSNAYGHGLIEIARLLRKEKVVFFMVDSLFEAVRLRNEGIRTKILVVGYTVVENMRGSRLNNVSFTITSLSQLKEVVEKVHKKIRCHIKIDTGMHRQGIAVSEIDETIALLQKNPHIILEGIGTHLGDADNDDASFTKDQIHAWNNAYDRFFEAFPYIRYSHVAATAGARYAPLTHANVIRLGRGLYGLHMNTGLSLTPVLEMTTLVTIVKEVKQGEYIGYGKGYRAEKDMTIAVLPVGYYEGVDRRLSNIGYMKVHNVLCPIVGRVCMNVLCIDVSNAGKVLRGDKVTVISRDNGESNSIVSLSQICDTVPHELLIHIPEHLRRVIV